MSSMSAPATKRNRFSLERQHVKTFLLLTELQPVRYWHDVGRLTSLKPWDIADKHVTLKVCHERETDISME